MPDTDTNPRSSIRKEEEEEDDDDEQGTSRETNSNSHCSRKMKGMNRGAWTAEEDMKLAQVIEIFGPRRWKSVASKAGLNRCGKSCRLRWLNYLRPNIKRGNISDQEEDLILRLHKLLGNRWSLIAGRLPGRTDNEIKNYWNSHLSKKIKQGGRRDSRGKPGVDGEGKKCSGNEEEERSVDGDEVKSRSKNEEESSSNGCGSNNSSSYCEELLSGEMMNFNVDDFFDFSNENQSNLEWLSKFLQLDADISSPF